jgi:LPXTG-motif cell wall-anchored protein
MAAPRTGYGQAMLTIILIILVILLLTGGIGYNRRGRGV